MVGKASVDPRSFEDKRCFFYFFFKLATVSLAHTALSNTLLLNFFFINCHANFHFACIRGSYTESGGGIGVYRCSTSEFPGKEQETGVSGSADTSQRLHSGVYLPVAAGL